MAWITSSTGVARLSPRLFSISSRARSLPGRSGMILRLEHGEAFIRVEDVALHIGGFGWPPAELVHRADETHPVEDLLLPAILDRAQRPLPPGRVVGGLQRVVESSIGLGIGGEQVVFGRQEGVRPAGGRDQRDPPRAFLDDPGAGRAEIETAPWGRGGGIELVLLGELAQPARAGLLGDNTAAIAVHLERDDGVGET